MADSGASSNLLDEGNYQKMEKPPKLHRSKVTIFPHHPKNPLPVSGEFYAAIESDKEIMEDMFCHQWKQ